MAGSNGTITVEELKKLLEEWNLVIGFLFLTWICLLQFAYANRNRFLYIIKLIFLWLLWPVTLTCFVLAAVYRINWITGGIAIAMACLSDCLRVRVPCGHSIQKLTFFSTCHSMALF